MNTTMNNDEDCQMPNEDTDQPKRWKLDDPTDFLARHDAGLYDDGMPAQDPREHLLYTGHTLTDYWCPHCGIQNVVRVPDNLMHPIPWLKSMAGETGRVISNTRLFTHRCVECNHIFWTASTEWNENT